MTPALRALSCGLAAAALAALLGAAALAAPAELDEKTRTMVEALSRLKGVDLEASPGVKAAVLRALDKVRGTPLLVEIVRDFKIKGEAAALIEYAVANPGASGGVEAGRIALAEVGSGPLVALLATGQAANAAELLGNLGDKSLVAPLAAKLLSSTVPAERRACATALTRSRDGAEALLAMAASGALPADVRLLCSTDLNLAPWPEIKTAAATLLPLPASLNAEPLPPISELLRREGDVERGRGVFFSAESTCSNCHQIRGQGVDFGPALSEIGTKLGKDALYEAILEPSAGISFGYEGWQIDTKDGEEAFGIIVSETADEIALKAQTGVVTRLKKADIAKRSKSTLSVMPAGLQLTMSPAQLVDLVTFLSSLKGKAP